MDFGAFARLTRIEHSVMLCAAVLIGEIIALGRLPPLDFMLLTLIPPFFIGLSSFAINDYFDVEADRKNKRLDRPLVSGEIKMGEALAISLAAFLAGSAASWFINPACFLIALAFGLFAFLYSYKLKDVALVGNTYIAFTMAIPFIFGNMAVSPSISQPALLLALIAFVTGLGREIMGTVRDLEGDRLRGSATLPMIIGAQMSLLFSSFLYILAVLASAFPFMFAEQYKNDFNYLIPVLICDAILLYIAARAPSNSSEFLKQSRTLSLIAMAFGLLAFLLGALI